MARSTFAPPPVRREVTPSRGPCGVDHAAPPKAALCGNHADTQPPCTPPRCRERPHRRQKEKKRRQKKPRLAFGHQSPSRRRLPTVPVASPCAHRARVADVGRRPRCPAPSSGPRPPSPPRESSRFRSARAPFAGLSRRRDLAPLPASSKGSSPVRTSPGRRPKMTPSARSLGS